MDKDIAKKKTTLKGTVVSGASGKTLVVEINTLKTHAKYRKKYKATKRYKVHDPEGSRKTGETVEFEMCRPISKDKKFIIVR